VGAEALLRWTHPERGPVSPAEFIPVAEDSGLIIPIGAWVLEEACRQARAWLDQGLAIGVIAVNVAGLQIQRGDLAETVAAVLARTGLPAQRLELEISESYIMRHAERDLRQLAQLRELGVALAIDDFGTGQTSLSHLWRLPLSKLKVDRAFIKDLERDAAGATVTRAVIGLGHGLGFVVQAEGGNRGPGRLPDRPRLRPGAGLRLRPAHAGGRLCPPLRRGDPGNPGCLAEKPGSL
jgi:EAL domain-containing protein (putative c-di-GMP-specific phosphodiesterase class I)